jgi:hypothetical protein
MTAGKPGSPDPAGPTNPATTEQPRRTTGPTRTPDTGTGDTGSAVAAIAQQKPARPTVLARPRGPVSAVTDQRPPE